MTAPFGTQLLNDPPAVSVSSSPQYQNYVPPLPMPCFPELTRSVGLSPLAHLPLSLPSLLPHPPGERRKKPFNILFFSLLLLLLYIRLFLFSSSYPLLVFPFSFSPLFPDSARRVWERDRLVRGRRELALNLTGKERSRKRYLFTSQRQNQSLDPLSN
jgi:hypothetical protein